MRFQDRDVTVHKCDHFLGRAVVAKYKIYIKFIISACAIGRNNVTGNASSSKMQEINGLKTFVLEC